MSKTLRNLLLGAALALLVALGIGVWYLQRLTPDIEIIAPTAAESFESTLATAYAGEEVLHYNFWSDLDSDSLMELVVRIDREKAMQIIERLPVEPAAAETAEPFGAIAVPDDASRWTLNISRKGTLDLWFHEPTATLFVRDWWCC